MTPMSSRQRAVLHLPSQGTLFVNRIGVSVDDDHADVSSDRYSIKSASAAMKKGKKDGINTASTVFYNKHGVAVHQSTIEVPDGWTPRLFLGILFHEWRKSNVVSIFQVDDGRLDDIIQIRHAYFGCPTIQLHLLTIRSPSYSFVIGGF
jgi:hypothetical protein